MERPLPKAYQAPTLAQHLAAGGPKRVLALDGGGVRGILTLGFLERMEALLRQRHGGDPAFRLCDYFDLIAGTSTGSIIAALLAQGRSVAEVITLYRQLADQVFARDLWRQGVLRARYGRAALVGYLQSNLGASCRMGDGERLRTGLLIVTKRFDTGKPWPIGNNPGGCYFHPRPGSTVIANCDYPLWQVVRASTAAPTFFEPETIPISNPSTGLKPEDGSFVDGGVSPHNNPALQAYLYATLSGYNLRWQPDPEKLLIISVGTGRPNPAPRPRGWLAKRLGRLSAVQGITALTGLMNDCSLLVEALMQGMGTCLTPPRTIDADMQTLCEHELVSAPRFRYARYDVKLFRDRTPPRDGIDDTPILQQLGLDGAALLPLEQMDNPRPKELLLALGQAAAAEKVLEEHFPAGFDLPRPSPLGASEGRRAYRRRESRPVVAVQLTMEMDGFLYQKWGAQQVCKRGDWLVNNNGSVYTVDGEVFARTYRPVGPGLYEKHTTIWAEPAAAAGAVSTLEGETHYQAGDYLVWNDAEGRDVYAISRARFEELYEPLGE